MHADVLSTLQYVDNLDVFPFLLQNGYSRRNHRSYDKNPKQAQHSKNKTSNSNTIEYDRGIRFFGRVSIFFIPCGSLRKPLVIPTYCVGRIVMAMHTPFLKGVCFFAWRRRGISLRLGSP